MLSTNYIAETFSAASLRISETGRESFKPVLANCSFLPSMDGVPTFKTGLSFIAICIFPGPPIGIIFSLDIMQSIDGRNCQLQGVFGSPFSSRNRALYADNGQRKQKKRNLTHITFHVIKMWVSGHFVPWLLRSKSVRSMLL